MEGTERRYGLHKMKVATDGIGVKENHKKKDAGGRASLALRAKLVKTIKYHEGEREGREQKEGHWTGKASRILQQG